MTHAEAMFRLGEIAGEGMRDRDYEVAHAHADEVLLALVDPDIKAAYELVVESVGRWASA